MIDFSTPGVAIFSIFELCEIYAQKLREKNTSL